MTIIEKGDARIAKIFGKKASPDKFYRLSCYSVSCDSGNDLILHSTLSGMTVLLSEEEKFFINTGEPVRGADIIDNNITELVSDCFLIEKETDEYEQYRLVISVLKSLSKESKGVKSFTILPTTGCNARCVYCYEQGMAVRTMSRETADRTADFIDRTRWKDPVKLIWFGGEPLVGSNIISHICGRLIEKNIEFTSSIVTNATLFTPESVDEAVSCWHLRSAQVSVDGKREDYEDRKRYYNPSINNYDRAMEAIGYLLDRGVKVTLRCNYDSVNSDGLKTFFEDVKRRFGDTDNLNVYMAMLFQAKEHESCVDLYRETQSYIEDIGIKHSDDSHNSGKLKLNYCMADSDGKCVVIDPDGELYNCEHLPTNTSFGSIYDPDVTVNSDARAKLPANDICKTCSFLPTCTPFFRNGCPDHFEYCREFKKIKFDKMLRRIVTK